MDALGLHQGSLDVEQSVQLGVVADNVADAALSDHRQPVHWRSAAAQLAPQSRERSVSRSRSVTRRLRRAAWVRHGQGTEKETLRRFLARAHPRPLRLSRNFSWHEEQKRRT